MIPRRVKNNMCGKKMYFPTKGSAERCASHFGQKVYECPICFGWHCTNNKDWKSELISPSQLETEVRLARTELNRKLREKNLRIQQMEKEIKELKERLEMTPAPTDLMPCPFCGEEVKLHHISEAGRSFMGPCWKTGFRVSCDKCNLDMSMGDQGDALKKWNHRADLVPRQAVTGDVPAGAIHNGREFAEQMESNWQDYRLYECYEWQEFKRCFEHLAEYVSMHPAVPAEQTDKDAQRALDEFNQHLKYYDDPNGTIETDNPPEKQETTRTGLFVTIKAETDKDAIMALNRLLNDALASRDGYGDSRKDAETIRRALSASAREGSNG